MSKYGVTSGPNTGKYGPEINSHLDTFQAVYDGVFRKVTLPEISRGPLLTEVVDLQYAFATLLEPNP